MSDSEIWGVGAYRSAAMVDRRKVGGLVKRLAFLGTRSSFDTSYPWRRNGASTGERHGM
jgi:hypothetical protein